MPAEPCMVCGAAARNLLLWDENCSDTYRIYAQEIRAGTY
jgi:hypothetical protein